MAITSAEYSRNINQLAATEQNADSPAAKLLTLLDNSQDLLFQGKDDIQPIKIYQVSRIQAGQDMSADHHTDMAISPHYYSFTQKNILIMSDFIVELLVRLFSKTPWFFKVVQIISAIALVVSGLPQLLAKSGVSIPDAWTGTVSQIVSIASMVAIFLAQLTTTTKVKAEEKLKD